MKIFGSPCCIQIANRPVSCAGGWVKLTAEKEILIVVVSLVVHCYAVKNVIVTSQLYDVSDVQFTVEKEGPLELLQFIHKYNLWNTVPNIVIKLRIFLTIAVSVATCERNFSKLKLIKNYLRSSMSTLWLRNLATLSTEQQMTDYKFWHCHWRISQQNGKKSYYVENCSFHFKNKDGLNFYTFFTIFLNTSFLLFVLLLLTIKHTIFEHVRVL